MDTNLKDIGPSIASVQRGGELNRVKLSSLNILKCFIEKRTLEVLCVYLTTKKYYWMKSLNTKYMVTNANEGLFEQITLEPLC